MSMATFKVTGYFPFLFVLNLRFSHSTHTSLFEVCVAGRFFQAACGEEGPIAEGAGMPVGSISFHQ